MPPSRQSNNTESVLLDFSKNIDLINDMMQKFLQDLHDGQLQFVALQSELNNLVSNFKELSKNFQFNQSRLSDFNVKVALLESTITRLEARFAEHEKELKAQAAADKTGRWAARAATISGVMGFLAALASVLYQALK